MNDLKVVSFTLLQMRLLLGEIERRWRNSVMPDCIIIEYKNLRDSIKWLERTVIEINERERSNV